MRKFIALPDSNYLHTCFTYNNGDLIWKSRPRSHFNTDKGMNQSNAVHLGKSAIMDARTGYKRVILNGVNYLAHRLIWAMFNPDDDISILEIDHINGVRIDNRIENLRSGTHRQNQYNLRHKPNSILKLKGVSQNPNGRYYTRIRINGICKNIGTFDTKEEAHEAYRNAAELHHGEFRNFGEFENTKDKAVQGCSKWEMRNLM